MDADDEVADLIAHIERLTPLGRGEVRRLVGEVTAYFSESVEEFVARRHAQLQREDLRNEAIFERIERELRVRRFAAPALTTRQVRRIVYG
ncbi:MAG TPA: hypothetical protein VKA21_05610 [Candidatus Binatia bacterium]|nr:hypothetical protein [Candidatus Binatia bacterium]